METLQALQQEAAVMKAQIDKLRADAAETDPDGSQSTKAMMAQKGLDKLEDNYRLILNSIATVSNARGTPSATHELERLDERGDVIRAGQPNQNARVVKVRDPKTGTITDMPDPSGAAAKPTPTPTAQMDRIDANGQVIPAGDTTTKAVAMRDPTTGGQVNLPDVAAGGKPTVVQGQRGEMFSWDGSKLTQLQPGTPEKPQLVQAAGGAIYSWDGKALSTLQPGKKEPQENDTRPNVKDGYHVTETYIGGDWVPTRYGDPAKPGEPTEGMTRPNTKEGYKVTETYSGGDWTVTNVGERATPREPRELSAPADQQYIVRTDAQGNPVNIANPNYRPKTQGDIAARVGQLQSLANAKKEEVMKKVSGTFTADQALSEFNTWWDQNVQPQTTALQAAAEEANFARGKEVAAMRTSAQTAALGAGTLRQRAIEDQQKRTVSGGFLGEMGKVWNATRQGQVSEPIDYTKLGRPVRDVAGESERAVAEALKYIDPTAAQMTGTTAANWQATNPADALNRTSYTAGGFGGPAAAPVVAAAGGGGAPVMTNQPRADQISGATPMGNALASGPGLTGTVNPGDSNFMGMTAEQADALRAAAEAQTTGDLQELTSSMAQNDVYQYGGGPSAMPVGEYPLRRRAQPVAPAPPAVNMDPFAQQALAAGLGAGGLGPTAPLPFYQQALAAGLGQGGLNPSRWVPPQYEYLGGPVPY